MPQSCDTRWFSKHKDVKFFKTRLAAILLALEEFVKKGQPSEAVQWEGYINELRSFKTVLILVVLEKVLAEVACLSVRTSSKFQDIVHEGWRAFPDN